MFVRPLLASKWHHVGIGVLALAAAGCFGTKPSATVPPNDQKQAVSPTLAESTGTSVFDQPLRRLTVEFTVHRITAPKGTFTQDGGVWKLVTGPLSSAQATLKLAANGMRAVIGQESDRPGLLAELSKMADPKIALDHVIPDVNRSLELELGPCAPRLSLFHYDESGEIHGCDFLNAKSRFKMDYEMRFSNLNEVVVQVVPEIEEPPGPRRWVRSSEGVPQEMEEEHKTTFQSLAFQAGISGGGFLMMGPTAVLHDQPLLARAFFLQGGIGPDGKEIPVRESIYVISPIIRSYTPRPAVTERTQGDESIEHP